MRVNINFYFDKDTDGYDGSADFSRDGIETLEEIAQLLTDAMRGAGFSYVSNTGFEKDDGSVTFGVF